MLFQANQQIGNYTLIKFLGEGGFGEVWLAENHNNPSSEKVAIKLPRKEQIDLQAVKDEIFNWTVAGKHKNIIPFIECEIFGNQIAIVSEFAPDGSLQDLLKKHRLFSVADAVEIILGILDGLMHLHHRRIIHRDLKPDNVLFQGKVPRLTDFGISRAMQINSQSDNARGTFSYMSAEAFDGKHNAQTDIWSVGVILYQMLSGNLPFPQQYQIELIGALVKKEPKSLPDSVPLDLQNIVKKSLAKDLSERYQTADEMREALRNTLISQKLVESQTNSQAKTLVLEDSYKTAKIEIASIQETIPIIEDNERKTELLNVQPEIKTTVRQQTREASERIDRHADKTEQLTIKPIKEYKPPKESWLSDRENPLYMMGAVTICFPFIAGTFYLFNFIGISNYVGKFFYGLIYVIIPPSYLLIFAFVVNKYCSGENSIMDKLLPFMGIFGILLLIIFILSYLFFGFNPQIQF